MKMYKSMVGSSVAHHVLKQLWKCSAQLRHKIFFWLPLYDRVNTRNLLNRKSMYLEDYNCVLCNDKVEETLMCLFWDCPFAGECWDYIIPHRKRGISCNDEICINASVPHKEIALNIILMGCWGIW